MPSNGLGGIWLGQVPENCNYDIYLYESDGQHLIAKSTKGVGMTEYIRTRFYAGIPVLVKVVSESGFDASFQYMLRIKNLPLGNARTFTFRYNDGLDTTPMSFFATYLRSSGYNSIFYIDNLAISASTVLTNSQIYLIDGHGSPGTMSFDEGTNMYAKAPSFIQSNDFALDSLASGDLSEIQLIIFAGCNTGANNSIYGNLVDMALSKGARLAVGWTESIYWPTSLYYFEYFKNSLDGSSVENAFDNADSLIEGESPYDYLMMDEFRYVGTSKLDSVNLV